MTYIVKQKIHSRTYAYEAENCWDPVKKQSWQKRRYLGVWDESTAKSFLKPQKEKSRPQNHLAQLIF